MKKYIYGFLLVLISCFSMANIAMAQDTTQIMPANDELYKVDSMEDIEKDLTKRFILGTFGKDALIYFLPKETPDSLEDQIRGLSDAEVYRISKPFNSSIISGTLIIIAAFFLVAVVTMLFYVVWVYAESLLRTQDSGEFLGSRWSKVFTPLKIIVGFFLIFPMFGQSHPPFTGSGSTDGSWNVGAFSLAQFAILTSAGASNQQANIVFGEFVRAMPRHYPAINMPNMASKTAFMSDVIDFMVCAKASYGQNINVNFTRFDTVDKSVYKMKAAAGKCEISGQVGYDEATDTELKNNNMLRELIGNVGYEGMQKKAIQKALTNMFSTASTIADAIIRAESSSSLLSTALPISPTDWRASCGNIGSQLPEDATEDGVILYTYYAANCLSKQFIEDLSKTTLDSSYLYGPSNYLKGNAFELCVNDSGFSGTTKALTFAKYKEDEFVFGSKYKLVQSCVAEACSGDKVYECASAIQFAKSIADKEEIAKMGWITGGANAYKIFSGFENAAARSIINKSSFSVDYYSTRKEYINLYANEGSVIDSISIPINATNPERSFESSGFDKYVDRKGTRYNDIVSENAQVKSFLDGGNDGWFGIPKLQNCVEHPMKIYNGFVCGNVTEEVHIFGSKLIALGVQVKMASLFISKNYGKNKKTDGTVSSRMVQKLKSAGSMLDGAAPRLFILYLLGDTLGGTDSFSDIDQEIWQQYPEVIGFASTALVAGASGSDLVSSSVSQILNLFIGLCIFLGVMFGFLMPLLPFALWMLAIGGWIIALFEALVLCQIWGVVLISPSADHSSDAAKKSTIIVVSILLKAPLLVIGLILAWLLNNILLSEMLMFSDISTALALDSAGLIKGIIDQLIVLIIYFVILYGMYNIIFSLIESFEKITIDVLFSGQSMSPFAQKQRDANWQASIKTAANTLMKK